MTSYRYERLSAQDNTFLVGETHTMHMHVAGVQIFEAGPLKTEGGGIDFEKIRRGTERLLHRIPRYRQKLMWTPLFEQPVWVDDPDFALDFHMRHTALPRPGGLKELKQLSSRIMAQQLDRARPLWELWIVEGLSDDRFAIISKIHHCMIDGMAGMDLMRVIMSISPEYEEEGDPPPYRPKRAPSGLKLLRDEVALRAGAPRRAIRGIRQFQRETEDLKTDIKIRSRAIGELLGWAVHPAEETPLNGELSPHRRFDWTKMPLDEVKAIRRAAGASVNDVVLAIVSGAVREYMIYRSVDPSRLEFRVSAPVSVRRDDERGHMGNRVSSWILPIPIGEASPKSRLEQIHAETQSLKESKQALGVEMMMQVAEWTPKTLLSLGAQAASGPINTIVTNVPGPQFPIYMFGARLLEMYPVVPLLENMGVGIALFSYDGQVLWGFNADYSLVPDLRKFVELVQSSFRELADAYGVKATEAPEADDEAEADPAAARAAG